MSKARDLADLLSAGGVLEDGQISVSEIESLTVNATELNKLDGVTATTAQINFVVGVTSGIQTQLNTKATLVSPSLTGTPTAPTATANDNSTKIASTAYVETAVTNLVNAAPAALNTLDELAAALGDDANFSATITTSLSTKLTETDLKSSFLL